MRLNNLLVAVLSSSAPAVAQVIPAIPYPRTLDLMVVDSLADALWRLTDFNQDGDYDDAGELLAYYDDLTGSLVLTNPACVAAAPDGTVYIGDSTEDYILALRDQNGDGDANDPGEYRVFFDGSNAGALVFSSVQSLTVDVLGRVFVAQANTGSGGIDQILKLEDLDHDGDANDLGEAADYYTVQGGAGPVGNSIPTEVRAGWDNNLYYVENGSTGAVTRGVWKLADLNFDGDCNDPFEVSLYWTPGPQPLPNSPFYWSLAIDRAGAFYITDHSANHQVWRGQDIDGSGVIDPNEETLFYQTGASTWWDIEVRDDGWILICEDTTPDRLVALRDLNGDGDALDAGEQYDAYNDTVAATDLPRPRGAAFLRAPELAVTPVPVPLGSPATFRVLTERPVQLAALFLSVAVMPAASVPPFGRLEVDPSNFAPIGFGVSDATGQFVLAVPIPNVPTAIGTWGAQSLSGDAYRLFLSNGTPMIVQ